MGTTWLFNVLRAIAYTSENPTFVVADGAPLPKKSWQGPIIIKSHRADTPDLLDEYRPHIGICAFVMLRDAQSTFASLLRTQSETPQTLLTWLDRDLRTYEVSLPHLQNVASIREEWIPTQSTNIIGRISKLLGWKIDTEDAVEIASDYSKDSVRQRVKELRQRNSWNGDFTNFDPDSQWHANHISDGNYAIQDLDPDTHAALANLQVRIDALTEKHSIWRQESFHDQESECRAVDYVRERDARSRIHYSALTRLRIKIRTRARRRLA